jgi:hypothetical protein
MRKARTSSFAQTSVYARGLKVRISASEPRFAPSQPCGRASEKIHVNMRFRGCVDCNEEAHLVAQMAGQTKRRKHVCQHSILLFNIEHSVMQMDWRALGARVPRVPLGLDVVDRSRTSTLIVHEVSPHRRRARPFGHSGSCAFPKAARRRESSKGNACARLCLSLKQNTHGFIRFPCASGLVFC